MTLVTRTAGGGWLLVTLEMNLSHLFACAVPLGAVVVLLMPSLGGYGLITWCLHPLAAVVGCLVLLPLGLSAGVDVPDRKWHALLLGGFAVCVLTAAATAWGIHEAAGHRHLPRWDKSVVYHLHVWGSYLLCAALLAQAAGGASAFLGLRGGAPLDWLRRQHKSVGVAAAALAVLLLGFAIPMAVKGGGLTTFAVLALGVLGGAYRVYVKIPKGRGGGK